MGPAVAKASAKTAGLCMCVSGKPVSDAIDPFSATFRRLFLHCMT